MSSADHVVPTVAPLSPRPRAPVGRVVAPEILLEWPGLMEAEDPAMRERLVALKLQRDQIAREIGELQNRMASSAPTITPERVARIGGPLRKRLYEGPPELRQASARLLLDEVRVTDEEIRISGPKSVLASCAAEGTVEPLPKVLSLCSRLARPTGFEPVASAFGGKRTPRPVMVPARRAVGDSWSSSIGLTAWSRVSAASAAAPLGCH